MLYYVHSDFRIGDCCAIIRENMKMEFGKYILCLLLKKVPLRYRNTFSIIFFISRNSGYDVHRDWL